MAKKKHPTAPAEARRETVVLTAHDLDALVRYLDTVAETLLDHISRANHTEREYEQASRDVIKVSNGLDDIRRFLSSHGINTAAFPAARRRS